MRSCSTVDVLYAAVPLRRFRDWLISAHMERCPRCQARLLSRDEAQSLLVEPGRVGGVDDLWRRIAGALEPAAPVRGRTAEAGSGWWRWAAVPAMAAAVTLGGFWLLRNVEKPGFDAVTIASAERFELDYVKVAGAPAQTFVYQAQGTDAVFVWVSKTP